MKIAIPVWEGKVSPVFDTASRLLVFDVEDAKETKRFQTSLDEKDLGRRCSRIKGLGVELLICGAISSQFRDMLIASGVKVIPWISGQTEEVVKAYLSGRLCDPKFLMPGCGEEQMKEMAEICDIRK
ncbi:MAG: NifB/NifX family molybdenum-iron cluster-binding protein [Deltaproteobacteria bacterium]|nr:NifB/NifX family molybdenum-iron cluster-binding protein [Deltaproteobacteria bacterium]MBW1928257.1 NifB/NifX family molybdenum-iron cluster-binding protein [Deltaproteobacteria bacterium]MBW2025961.1 NifB/NifX family molybdenum-iron cluster-binding protein [Deltaproteobacteria bacterium]MBW2125613.1 NifB/NifX family molybdenum-iron cluster-binding protein [Deltaproteobacteria bacterium]RLB16062.1 MAG: dinitrogenase iron-molybdenum cofactor biosynthesis protein [Deltaproteobacteria bacteriu